MVDCTTYKQRNLKDTGARCDNRSTLVPEVHKDHGSYYGPCHTRES